MVTPCWSYMSCKMWMIRGSPRTPDRLPRLSSSHVQQSEVCETMTGTCGPYNLGGSTKTGIRAHIWICNNITFENFKRYLQIKSFWRSTKLKLLFNLPYACYPSSVEASWWLKWKAPKSFNSFSTSHVKNWTSPIIPYRVSINFSSGAVKIM